MSDVTDFTFRFDAQSGILEFLSPNLMEMREARWSKFSFSFSHLEEAMQAMRGRWIAIPTAVSSGAVRAPHGGFCTVVYVQALSAAASC